MIEVLAYVKFDGNFYGFSQETIENGEKYKPDNSDYQAYCLVA